MTHQFNIGDIVRLKSSGPSMTVFYFPGDYIICQWFDNNTLHSGRFDSECLILQTP